MTRRAKDYTETSLRTTLLVYLALALLASVEALLIYYINRGLV